MTGSDLIIPIIKEIKVIFMARKAEENNVTRAPATHTCGPRLELPHSYVNATELSREFKIIYSCTCLWDFKDCKNTIFFKTKNEEGGICTSLKTSHLLRKTFMDSQI